MLLKQMERKRSRLLRGMLYALILATIGGCFGFSDRLAAFVAPKPDYYRILFTELARQTFLQTGTPTIVKEDDDTLATFETEFNRRNAKLGFPKGHAYIPDNALLQFSYAPGMIQELGPGLTEIPGSQLVRENTRPVIWQDEPGLRPLVVWTYSKRERLLICFAYQLLTPDHPTSLRPPYPDLRLIQSIDWSGVVSTQGSIPDLKVFPEHAYLLPLGDLKLENLDRPIPGLKLDNLDQHTAEIPNLFVFVHGLPMVVSPGHNETNAPPVPSTGETIMLLRDRVARPLILTRRVFRLGILPLGILWLGLNCWRMRRLHRGFCKRIDRLIPGPSSHLQIGFLAFLTADLAAHLSRAEATARAAQELQLAEERERDELNRLKDELSGLVAGASVGPNEAAQIDRAIATGSLAEMRFVADHFSHKIEREGQLARDRQREIQWLESEFEAIPTIKREEAPEAWKLYQRAIGLDDPRERLHWLKEARKRMPKNLKSEAV